jgi:hypothetical protein
MRRKREEWPRLVARWEASGESVAVFGRRVGANAMTLYRWRREPWSDESGPALSKSFRSTNTLADGGDGGCYLVWGCWSSKPRDARLNRLDRAAIPHYKITTLANVASQNPSNFR